MRSIISVIACTSLLIGCGSTNNKSDLRDVATNLEGQLAIAKERNNVLQDENRVLKLKVNKLSGVVSVLDTEKTSRVKESSALRNKVRKFVQREITGLKSFLIEGGLLDYIGGELVQRSNVEDTPMTIVDLHNRINSSGILTSIGAYVIKPSTVKVKVLRYIESKLVVIWESKSIRMNLVGPNRHQFVDSVSVEKGDVIAYEFSKNVGVGFSEGTADSRYSKKLVMLGDSIHVSSLLGAKKKRAYSIGVYGLLNQ
ncbi:MAG: hypothetical protein HRT52_15005 [Colwellia sp.]|nr:hypothetical protein [Colwellia sp.]NQZ82316.1 hypothetical protein [Colwellia sp.]